MAAGSSNFPFHDMFIYRLRHMFCNYFGHGLTAQMHIVLSIDAEIRSGFGDKNLMFVISPVCPLKIPSTLLNSKS